MPDYLIRSVSVLLYFVKVIKHGIKERSFQVQDHGKVRSDNHFQRNGKRICLKLLKKGG